MHPVVESIKLTLQAGLEEATRAARRAQPPHAGLGRPRARRGHAALRQPVRLLRAARLQGRPDRGRPVHDLRRHAQGSEGDRRADRRARVLLQASSAMPRRTSPRASSACARCSTSIATCPAASSRSPSSIRSRSPRPKIVPSPPACAACASTRRASRATSASSLQHHRQRLFHPLLRRRARPLHRIRRDQADLRAGQPEEEGDRPDHQPADRWRHDAADGHGAAAAADSAADDHGADPRGVRDQVHRQGRHRDPGRYRRADAGRSPISRRRWPMPSTSSCSKAARCWPSPIPIAEMAKLLGPMMAHLGQRSADFDKLLKAWGVNADVSKIAADISFARRVQFGGGRGGGQVWSPTMSRG